MNDILYHDISFHGYRLGVNLANIQLKIRHTQLFENINNILSHKFCSVTFSYSALFFLSTQTSSHDSQICMLIM